MRYSLNIEEDIITYPLNHIQNNKNQLNNNIKIFSSLQQTTSLLINNDQIQLNHIINTIHMQNQIQQCPQIKIKMSQQIKIQKCKWLYAGQDQWILIQENPIKVYVALKKYQKMVDIKLQQQINLEQICCYMNYPLVIIYGHNSQKFTNHLYSINLLTFQVKQLSTNKDYSPGNRSNYWSYFTDGRLYIFGGFDKKDKPCQQLFWTYNLQNGNWFALDLGYFNLNLTNKSYNLQVQPGKVLSIQNGRSYIVQLYQSRIKQIQKNDKIDNNMLININNMLIYDNYIYLNINNISQPLKLKLIKIKNQK